MKIHSTPPHTGHLTPKVDNLSWIIISMIQATRGVKYARSQVRSGMLSILEDALRVDTDVVEA